MTSEQIKQAVADGISAYFDDPNCGGHLRCRYDIDPDAHHKQHESLAKFVAFIGRMEEVKWGVVQKAIAWVILGVFALAVYGAAVKIKFLKIFGG